MDVSVEIGNGLAIAEPTTPTTNTAGDAVRAEYAKILSDPTHPLHAGLWRGDKAVDDHINALYAKAYSTPRSAEDAPASIGTPAPSQPGETSEQAEIRERNALIMAPLRQEWGDAYHARLTRAVGSARTLFGGEGWGDVFEELGAIIRQEYGPAGETAAIRFLDALAGIKQQYGG